MNSLFRSLFMFFLGFASVQSFTNPAQLQAPSRPLSHAGDISRASMSQTFSRVGLNNLYSSASDIAQTEEEPLEWKKMGPALSLGKLKLNVFGGWFLVMSCFGYAPVWLAGLGTVRLMHMVLKGWDPNLKMYDTVSQWWARVVLRTGGCWPSIEGAENMPPKDEAVMFVANHTSWFDIVCISLLMGSKPFKFVSKGELLKVPVMGTSLKWGGHVLISRESRKSQMETLKKGVDWLKKGVSLITFAEGTRSKNGRIKKFKRGAIKMALKGNTRIVPVSLVGMHRAFPAWAVMPICPGGRFMRVVVPPPVATEGRDEGEIMEEVFAAVRAGLPAEQQ
mmetsp:Transcript_42272/g.73467  ORF Transcript_42272/g.73467 Transcript_42272/m.73467 type:complete len:335 (-) Transcript_42272:214-1218(-)